MEQLEYLKRNLSIDYFPVTKFSTVVVFGAY